MLLEVEGLGSIFISSGCTPSGSYVLLFFRILEFTKGFLFKKCSSWLRLKLQLKLSWRSGSGSAQAQAAAQAQAEAQAHAEGQAPKPSGLVLEVEGLGFVFMGSGCTPSGSYVLLFFSEFSNLRKDSF